MYGDIPPGTFYKWNVKFVIQAVACASDHFLQVDKARLVPCQFYAETRASLCSSPCAHLRGGRTSVPLRAGLLCPMSTAVIQNFPGAGDRQTLSSGCIWDLPPSWRDSAHYCDTALPQPHHPCRSLLQLYPSQMKCDLKTSFLWIFYWAHLYFFNFCCKPSVCGSFHIYVHARSPIELPSSCRYRRYCTDCVVAFSRNLWAS